MTSQVTSKTTSQRQIEANRANAQHSTGPRTPDGQARSAFNGLRHGLFARDVVLPGEDRAAYDDFLKRLNADLRPVGMVEKELLNRAAALWWRLGRTAAIEAGLLNPDWSNDPRAARRLTGGGPLVDAFRVALDDTRTLDVLGRYEGRLERALTRTLATFSRVQEARLKKQRKKAEKKPKKAPNKPEQKSSEP